MATQSKDESELTDSEKEEIAVIITIGKRQLGYGRR